MLKTQLNLGYGVQFFDIHKANSKWFAWYYDAKPVTALNAKEEIAKIS